MLCPVSDCEDMFPLDPLEAIKSGYTAALKKRGKGRQEAMTHVCGLIRVHGEEMKLMSDGLEQGWPISFDFGEFADRVMGLKDSLCGLIENDIVLDGSSAWVSFINAVYSSDTSLSRFQYLEADNKRKIMERDNSYG
jgi:hypothetical protein